MTGKLPIDDLGEKMRVGLQKARLKFLEQEAKVNGLVVIADKDGKITHVPALELLRQAKLAAL